MRWYRVYSTNDAINFQNKNDNEMAKIVRKNKTVTQENKNIKQLICVAQKFYDACLRGPTDFEALRVEPHRTALEKAINELGTLIAQTPDQNQENH